MTTEADAVANLANTTIDRLEALIEDSEQRISRLKAQLRECPQIVRVARLDGPPTDFPTERQMFATVQASQVEIVIQFQGWQLAGTISEITLEGKFG